MLVKKAQAGKTVKTTKKVVMPAKKVIKPTSPENVKKAVKKFKYNNLPNPSIEMAQTGKAVKKTTISKKPGNMLIPGMGVPNKAPKKVETMMAKSGTNLKKKK